jgi:preprotein translocase subunit SecG
MASTLLIVQFVLAITLTIAVLLQKSSSIGLGAYSGSNESLFGAKGPGSFLTKATMFIGLLFITNTLTLGYIYNQEKLGSAVDSVKVDSLIPATPAKSTAPVAPIAPTAPTIPASK